MTSNEAPQGDSADREQPDPTAPHASPEDPATNTRPPGNPDLDEGDAQRSEEKLNEVVGR